MTSLNFHTAHGWVGNSSTSQKQVQINADRLKECCDKKT